MPKKERLKIKKRVFPMDYYKIKTWRYIEKWGEEEIKKLYPDKQLNLFLGKEEAV